MKHSLAGSLVILATITLQATAAVVDYSSGEPITSSGYYQYHTKWVTTTCYETMTKTRDCSYDGGDFVGDYETVSPQVYPGPDYKDYKTVYETVYETAYPYPYKASEPLPYETVCYPETVYSTVYPDSSADIVYHTFTASGTDETATGSPIYHTVDSTIMQTVTAAPTQCEVIPIHNPSFEDPDWPGAWFLSDSVQRLSIADAITGTSVLEFSNTPGVVIPQLEQVIVLPIGNPIYFRFWFRRTAGADDGIIGATISLGSYNSATIGIGPGPSSWSGLGIGLNFNSPPCVPLVFSFKTEVTGASNDQTKIVQIDSIEGPSLSPIF